MLTRLLALAAVSTVVIAGCAADPGDEDLDGEEDVEMTDQQADALSSNGGSAKMYYLGSSSFLRRCAGNTLGCGRAVASVADTTPYFSAPRAWSRRTCDQWYTFRANGRCVEARRFEVSDRRHLLEGNPALMTGLGIRHSDGRNCAGWGEGNVTVEPGRTCAD